MKNNEVIIPHRVASLELVQEFYNINNLYKSDFSFNLLEEIFQVDIQRNDNICDIIIKGKISGGYIRFFNFQEDSSTPAIIYGNSYVYYSDGTPGTLLDFIQDLNKSGIKLKFKDCFLLMLN